MHEKEHTLLGMRKALVVLPYQHKGSIIVDMASQVNSYKTIVGLIEKHLFYSVILFFSVKSQKIVTDEIYIPKQSLTTLP